MTTQPSTSTNRKAARPSRERQIAGRSANGDRSNGSSSAGREALAVLAESVRDERRKQGMSQEALAHASGIHSSEISRIERGKHEPRLSTLVVLAQALRITPSDLLARVR